MNVLITGANGFVGRGLCAMVEESGHLVTRIVRQPNTPREISVGHINGNTDWSAALSPNIDAVVHLAARVHVMHEHSDTAATEYHEVNAEGTRKLAWQCAAQGIKRIIFMSTIKVLGEGRDLPYRHDDPAIPLGAYAISKWEAEQYLFEIAAQTGIEIVVLRPPLIYGPGVGANFLRLLQAVDRGLPLPLSAIQNQRSLIYLGNLLDAIKICLTHPDAAGKTYLVSDGEDVATPELMRRIGNALNRPPRLFPVPCSYMQFAGRLLGKQAAVERLVCSLTVDSQPIREELAWSPPYTMQAGLAATVEWYRNTEGSR